MHVLLIVFGLLLLLFGGGCTFIGVLLILGEPENFMRDFELIMSIWLPFGLLPLAVGFFLFRQGLKIDRRKRNAGVVASTASSSPGNDDGTHGPL